MNQIYMDNAATTPISAGVLAVMLPLFGDHFGNASAVYSTGRDARKALENARRQVAQAIGAKAGEVYFTSGGTESDNWAIKGTAFANRDKGKHIITSAIEHHAVLHTCEWLEKQGFEVTYLPVNADGIVEVREAEKAIRPDTVLMSIMAANNEIGTIQQVADLGALAKERKILFHTDAVQAAGAMPIDVNAWNCDLLSLSAHKFHGPKGVGALYIRSGTHIDPYLHGGAQERGKRASTENLPAAAGMGEALKEATEQLEENCMKTMLLRDHMLEELLKIPGCHLNGHRMQRLPGNINISLDGIEGEAMLLRLDLMGIAASSGSACTSGSLEPSHVLKALGLNDARAKGSLRFSLCPDNTEAEVTLAVKAVRQIAEELRSYA